MFTEAMEKAPQLYPVKQQSLWCHSTLRTNDDPTQRKTPFPWVEKKVSFYCKNDPP